MKSKLIAVLAVLLIVALGHSRLAGSGQVVKNSYEDTFPNIKGDYLVWQGHVHGDWEILLYNIATQEFSRVTDNDYGDVSPQTDGNYVVWLGFSHSGGEIFLYDISSGETTQITNDSNDSNVDSPPQIANGRVVWTSCEVTDSVEPGEIFLYDIATGQTEQLTDDTLDDSFPRINDERVIWVQADAGGITTLFIYDLPGGPAYEAPEGYVWKNSPQTDGDLTVSTRYDGNDREILVYDSSLRTYEQITDNHLEDRYPHISGNNITWVGGEGQPSEIFLNADIEPINTDFDPDDPDEPNSPSTSGSAPQGGSSGGSGGCFIATVVFGSAMEKHVTILKKFRDTYLFPCALGRLFVRTYNKYSPPLAQFIAKHEILKVVVRISLLALVAVSYATFHFGPVITLSMLVVLLILPIFLVSFYRRRAAAVR